jgi:outer membrane protein assembly factor BamB
VYLGTDRGVVLALDAADGTERWRFSAEGGVLSSPAVYDNRLFFGSMDRQLYVLK